MTFLKSRYKNYFVLPKEQAQIRKFPNGTIITIVRKGKICGIATGRYVKVGNFFWYEIYIGNTAAEIKKRRIGFVRHDVIKVSKTHPSSTTPQATPSGGGTSTSASHSTSVDVDKMQILLNKIIENDRKSLSNLMVAYRMAIEYKKRKIAIPHSMVLEFMKIWRNIASRRDNILRQKSIKASLGRPNPKNNIEKDTLNYFEAFIRNNGKMPDTIGVVPIIVIVVVAVIASGATIAVINALRPGYDASKANLKQSENLKTALANLDPKIREEIIADLESQIDDAYNKGRRDGNWRGMSKIIKPLALFFMGYFVITRIMDYEKRRI